MVKIIYILLLMAPLGCFGQSSFYEELNAIRKRHLLPALHIDSILEKESKGRVAVITKNKALMHTHLSNRYEVLAYGNEPLTLWLNSPGHRKTLLKRRIKRIGFYSENGYSCGRLQ